MLISAEVGVVLYQKKKLAMTWDTAAKSNASPNLVGTIENFTCFMCNFCLPFLVSTLMYSSVLACIATFPEARAGGWGGVCSVLL